MSDWYGWHTLPDQDASRQPGQPRECGGCNVCCTAMRVPALNKSAGQPCRHQTPQGCGIYEQRPEVCRVWYCMWVRDQQGVFLENHRPDRLGLFFSAKQDPRSQRTIIGAHEIFPGAIRQPEAQRLIEFLRQFAPVQMLPCRDTPMIEPTREGKPLAA